MKRYWKILLKNIAILILIECGHARLVWATNQLERTLRVCQHEANRLIIVAKWFLLECFFPCVHVCVCLSSSLSAVLLIWSPSCSSSHSTITLRSPRVWTLVNKSWFPAVESELQQHQVHLNEVNWGPAMKHSAVLMESRSRRTTSRAASCLLNSHQWTPTLLTPLIHTHSLTAPTWRAGGLKAVISWCILLSHYFCWVLTHPGNPGQPGKLLTKLPVMNHVWKWKKEKTTIFFF